MSKFSSSSSSVPGPSAMTSSGHKRGDVKNRRRERIGPSHARRKTSPSVERIPVIQPNRKVFRSLAPWNDSLLIILSTEFSWKTFAVCLPFTAFCIRHRSASFFFFVSLCCRLRLTLRLSQHGANDCRRSNDRQGNARKFQML